MKQIKLITLMIFTALVANIGFADGYPVPWQIDFQEAVTPLMHEMVAFHNMMLWIIFGISGFVLLLILVTCFKFKASRNPIPSKRTHNTLIEIIWTGVPVIILLIIAIPSFKLLYNTDVDREMDMTLKVTGYQWYWGYEYPDEGDLSFLSYIIPDDQIKPGEFRLLEVDNRVVLPTNTNIRIIITGADVIHAFAVPAFGIKTDAIPGRLNETWVRIEKEGVYHGQCSEICGLGHGFMPIAVEAVSPEKYKAWVNTAKQKFAALDLSTTIQLAENK